MGVLQELGTPDRLRLDNDRPWEWPDPNTPGPKAASGLCGATNTGARGGNRLAKATKWDGKDGRESERSISTAEAGELVPREPGGGKGAPRRGAVAGQQRGGIEPRSAVHETTTGSAAHVSPRRDEPDALMGHVRICGRRRGQPRRRPGPQQTTAVFQDCRGACGS